jgi:hypothetical protein
MEHERAIISDERQRKLAEVKSEIAHLMSAEKGKLKIDAEQAKGKLAASARDIALEIGRQILGRPIAG